MGFLCASCPLRDSRILTMCHSQVGESAIIIDAGGGTIDSSTYQKSKEGVYSFSEIAKPACTLSVFCCFP